VLNHVVKQGKTASEWEALKQFNKVKSFAPKEQQQLLDSQAELSVCFDDDYRGATPDNFDFGRRDENQKKRLL